MCDYIEFCADRLLLSLGCSKAYHTRNPFDWMDLISLQVGREGGRNGKKGGREGVPVSYSILPNSEATYPPPRFSFPPSLPPSLPPQGKTNFFEKRVGEYAKSGVGGNVEDQVFSLEAEF